MTQKDFALSLGLAGLAFLHFANSAFAGPPCAPRDQVLAHLGSKYAETRRAIGIAGESTVMELFAAESGTWTITVTTPEGMTCLVASGQGFEPVAEELPAAGDPA